MKTLLAIASAAAVMAAYALPAQAGGNGYYKPQGSYANNVSAKQNGNGCRNRCYGTQTFNAGVNNGNNSGNGNAYGHVNNVDVKQNGNGCRNRCYGTQTFNAGVNNGNKNKGYGH